MSGRTGLGAMAALLSRSALLVCNDTGVSHLAAALRVPSVVISTRSDPRRWAPADASRHRFLINDLENDAPTRAVVGQESERLLVREARRVAA
jgi:ADP-heptose:LPS heptosyltransferase